MSIRWVKGIVGSSFTAAVLVGCANHDPIVSVLPQLDGQYLVSAYDRTVSLAQKAAVNEADKFCLKRRKHAVFIKGTHHYIGGSNEATDANSLISGAANTELVTGSLSILSKKDQKDTLNSLGIKNSDPNSKSLDYQTEYLFRCR